VSSGRADHPRSSPPTAEVKAGDGRILAVETSGSPTGAPVFLLHGTPGSRSGPKPRTSVLYRLGVRLVCYDRPGYGVSERAEGRSVADAAGDVEAIANDLGLDRFAVVGRSGGGPHALACAALLSRRVTRAGVLVSFARTDAAGLDWSGGMTDANTAEFEAATADPLRLAEHLRIRAMRTMADPETMVTSLLAQMTEADKRIVNDIAIRRLLTETYREALRHGPYGWIDDVLALRRDWRFSFGAIRCPVRLWHGADDNFAPASHTRWLARRIPGAEVQVKPATAHFGAMEVVPEMLAWAVRDGAPAGHATRPADPEGVPEAGHSRR
jgi:pimeloyl-ACP methyl ester carboxylesterase